MNYYISDLHMFHDNILKLCKRPYSNVEDMNNDIIRRWNARVTPEDDVYILGDMFFKHKDIETVKNVLKQLKGKKHIIRGNHDKFLNQIRWQDYFESVDAYKEIDDRGRMVILFHYPIEEWNGYYRTSYHLFGHVHQNDTNLKYHERKINVGADVTDFEPKTLDELIRNNVKKPIDSVIRRY